jgi:hypothetical protein
MKGLRAVHFLLRDHLRGGGYNTASSYDTLGKSKYLRMRGEGILCFCLFGEV